ncbi:MAG: ABC transporter ATP-binding protein [Armatimonadota bacterium]|nr:ABC transporter ATP-binding protein [Armatimonadota bacterium]MDR7531864.1 ABC transporter ATP-binding protein [Armatimonadota bacterium]MDR7534791.1 ABC transporter ATP-binding protein [Armatimonadota bacterium]
MIAFEHVEKRYPGQAQPAVRDVSLTVPEGCTCVLVGPSGCGKTTLLKMVNRLVEPTAGVVRVAGQNVAEVDPVQLRRGIGYVIQQIGLFPHMTIAENVATVPRLLGWPPARIASRVDELLALVGMDPAVYRDRYPRQLSGGQAQRVGVARALAADPPIMLMDEPFGALDPITRERLQAEFLRIQHRLRKTILFVTHDLAEAFRMGDYVCILNEGQVRQVGTPDEVLARPAGAFVAAFLGTSRALRRLDLIRVETVVQEEPVRAGGRGTGRDGTTAPAEREATGAVPAVPRDASLAEALSVMLAEDVATLAVTDEGGRAVGTVSLDDIRRVMRTAPDAGAGHAGVGQRGS